MRRFRPIFQFSKQLGKTPIVVKDAPGFLVNRLLMPYLNEATYMLSRRSADRGFGPRDACVRDADGPDGADR